MKKDIVDILLLGRYIILYIKIGKLLVSIANSCHNCPIDDAPNANTKSGSSVNFCHGLGL